MTEDITENYVRKAKVLKVTDGDTIVCLVDMGFRLQMVQALRFNRIDAPELRTDAGKRARAFLLTKIQIGSEVLVQTYKNPDDLYGRWLADIYVNSECLNDTMVKTGNAVYKTY